MTDNVSAEQLRQFIERVEGKRVLVRLANGEVCGRAPVSPVSRTGWAASTTRWTRTDSPHHVDAYQVVR